VFLNPTQLLPHVKVLAVSWTVTAHGPLDQALLKFISLLSCLGSHGYGSEANATKDLLDALTCVSCLVWQERKPTGCFGKVGQGAWG
jgi:hypothetical protein